MRFAAVADIHGNAIALEAVLDDLRAQGVSEIVNLGDTASGPLEAARTIDLLIACKAVSIRGNHDRYLIERSPEKLGPWDRPAFDQLRSHHLDWLHGLSPTAIFQHDIFLCHGTPASDETYWLDTATPDGHVVLSSADFIEAAADGIGQSLILCGHTHLPRAVRLRNGRLVVNPGSVGSPAYRDSHPYPHIVEAGSPDARYAILEQRDRGWHVTFRHVPYDHQAAAALAMRAGQNDWVNALTLGRLV